MYQQKKKNLKNDQETDSRKDWRNHGDITQSEAFLDMICPAAFIFGCKQQDVTKRGRNDHKAPTLIR